MAIRIVCIGKNKDKYVKLAVEEYSKRLNGITDFDVIYLPSVSLTDTNNIEIVVKKEGKSILKMMDKLAKGSKKIFVALDINGKKFNSLDFSNFIAESISENELYFIIGGAYGICPDVKEKCDYLMNVSPFTLTHQITRIVLFEQIYRAFTIINNKKYHY